MTTVSRIDSRDAPTARAASTTPGSTATRLCSTMRPTANAAASESANVTASVPMVVPTTTAICSGLIAARKMTNGIGRTRFTTT